MLLKYNMMRAPFNSMKKYKYFIMLMIPRGQGMNGNRKKQMCSVDTQEIGERDTCVCMYVYV